MAAVVRTTRGLLLASHLGPTVVVTALAASLAVGVGAPPSTAVLVALAVLAGQLSVGWSNDWVDAARDRAVGRADKPVVRGDVAPVTLRRAAWSAVAVCAVLSLATGVGAGLVHLVAVAGAWAYNLRLKSSSWSWAPYAISFGLLLVFVVLALPGDARPAAWAVGAASLLGVGAHLANVLPDLDDDAATGVRGLPHRLGRRGTGVLAPLVLLVAVLLVAAAPGGATPGVLVVAGVAVTLGSVAGLVGVLVPRSRVPFTLAMAVAALCVVLLVVRADRLVAA